MNPRKKKAVLKLRCVTCGQAFRSENVRDFVCPDCERSKKARAKAVQGKLFDP